MVSSIIIWNYGRLLAEGARFISDSDTEVVLEAYKKWGEQCLDEFNGMFAFVLYDEDRGFTFLRARSVW